MEAGHAGSNEKLGKLRRERQGAQRHGVSGDRDALAHARDQQAAGQEPVQEGQAVASLGLEEKRLRESLQLLPGVSDIQGEREGLQVMDHRQGQECAGDAARCPSGKPGCDEGPVQTRDRAQKPGCEEVAAHCAGAVRRDVVPGRLAVEGAQLQALHRRGQEDGAGEGRGEADPREAGEEPERNEQQEILHEIGRREATPSGPGSIRLQGGQGPLPRQIHVAVKLEGNQGAVHDAQNGNKP